MRSKSKREQTTCDENPTPRDDVHQRTTTLKLEAQHRQGYAAHPVNGDEFSRWEAEQVWPD